VICFPPSQKNCAARPDRAAERKLLRTTPNGISLAGSPNFSVAPWISPSHRAALATSSTTLGPAGM